MKLTRPLFIFTISMTLLLFACDKDDSVTEPPVQEPPVQDPITVDATDFAITIDENPEGSSVLGTIQATTNRGSVNYTIESQSHTDALAINSLTGELSVENRDHFDFEVNTSLSATVLVANGTVNTSASVTIDLNNVVLSEEEGLLSFYPFDDDDINGTTALDEMSQARHGTTSGVQLVADRWDDYSGGKRAYAFGSGGKITIPSFGTDLDEFTISAWIRDNGSSETYRCIVSKAGSGREYVFRIEPMTCNCLAAHFTSGSNGLNTAESLVSNVWTHVAMVYKNGEVWIYQDGIEKSHKINMNPINWGSNDISIGSLTASGSEHFYGEIDDVGFLSKALTSDEINIISDDRPE